MNINPILKRILTGALFAQVLGLLSFPILSFFFRPEYIGLYGVCMSIISVISMSASCRMEKMIYLTSKENEIKFILILSYFLSMLLSLAASFYFVSFRPNDSIVNSHLYFFAIFLGGFFGALLQIQNSVLTMEKSYSFFSLLLVIRSLSLVLVLALLGILFGNDYILLACFFPAVLCYLISRTKQSLKFSIRDVANFKIYNINGYKYEIFLGFLQSLVSSLSNNVHILFASRMFSLETVGYFFLAEKLVKIPITLISNNLRGYILSVLKESDINTKFILVKFSVIMVSIALFFYVILLVFISQIRDLKFVSEWVQVIDLIQIYFSVVVFNFLGLPFQSYCSVFVKQSYFTFLEVLNFIFRFCFLLFLYFSGLDINYICYVLVFSTFIYCVMNIYLCFSALNNLRYRRSFNVKG